MICYHVLTFFCKLAPSYYINRGFLKSLSVLCKTVGIYCVINDIPLIQMHRCIPESNCINLQSAQQLGVPQRWPPGRLVCIFNHHLLNFLNISVKTVSLYFEQLNVLTCEKCAVFIWPPWYRAVFWQFVFHCVGACMIFVVESSSFILCSVLFLLCPPPIRYCCQSLCLSTLSICNRVIKVIFNTHIHYANCSLRRHLRSRTQRLRLSGLTKCRRETYQHTTLSVPRAGSGVVRMDPLRFLAGCRTRRLNQA